MSPSVARDFMAMVKAWAKIMATDFLTLLTLKKNPPYFDIQDDDCERDLLFLLFLPFWLFYLSTFWTFLSLF